jgi:hypothetical protein
VEVDEERVRPEEVTVHRRRFLGLGAGIVGTAGAARAARAADGATSEGHAHQDASAARAFEFLHRRDGSVERAYAFLALAMDAYQQGDTIRLIQSYADQLSLGSTAFVSDNAVAIIALLRRGRRDDMARARRLGDSFLYAQRHDTYGDGRLRQGYWVGPFTLPFTSNDSYFVRADGSVNLVGAPWFFLGSSVSDMSWVGIALARLFARTRQSRYLDGAVRLGQWIVDHAFDTVGLGGYSAGVDGQNQRLSSLKLTEHNVDVYALFTNLLAPLTGDASWADRGRHALEFVHRMWNPEGGFFFIGSNDGTTINPTPVLEEVQSQSYLALLDRRYAAALDWDKTNLVATDTPQSPHASFAGNLRFTGVTFSDVSRRAVEPASPTDPLPDLDAVWFQGTAHLAAALLARRRRADHDLVTFHGDVATAAEYLRHIALAQAQLGGGQTVGGVAIPEGAGVVAASSVLNSGTGFSYFPVLHIGATAWASIAAFGGNPYHL